MATEKTFTVVGVSTRNGVAKTRFSNDVATRQKMLVASGHTNIELIELPVAVDKVNAAQALFDAKVSSFARKVVGKFLVANGVDVEVETGAVRNAQGRFVKA